MTTTPHDDPARDAWLSEALRHAPDADAAPSAELSDAILRQARQAVKGPLAREPARPNPLAQLWAWLARPPVAAGFATVMVATLVGVMWWDRPLDDALPRSDTPAATSTVDPPVAPPPPVAAAPERAPEAPQAFESERKSANTAAAPAPKRDRAREPASERRAPAATTDASRARRAEAAAPPPAAAPSMSPAPAAAPAPTGEIAAKSATAPARDEALQEGSSSAPARALAKSAPAAATAGGLALRAQDSTIPLLTIDEPRRWSWQRDAAMRAMTPALQRWLVQLDGAAHWRPADSPPPSAGPHIMLQLWRDGVPRATITLGDDAVWLTPADGAPMMAPLAPAVAASLKATLITAAP